MQQQHCATIYYLKLRIELFPRDVYLHERANQINIKDKNDHLTYAVMEKKCSV